MRAALLGTVVGLDVGFLIQSNYVIGTPFGTVLGIGSTDGIGVVSKDDHECSRLTGVGGGTNGAYHPHGRTA